MHSLNSILNLDFALIAHNLITVGTAYLISLPIAWDREKEAKSAGLRTFPIVAVATCGFTLLGIDVLDTADAEARVLQGVITGIGFIGGGAILKKQDGTSGTATAASLWSTGAIGIAVAFGKIEIAISLSLINFITLRYIKRFKTKK